jgi:putative NIF3 family GTP cyclohydrolase 1 type 2
MKYYILLCLLFCFQGVISVGNLTLEFPTLTKLVLRLKEFAPLETATEWDNVGLLIEPSGPILVKKMLVTNDLTIPVLNEAIEKKVDLIVSYHPPITKSPPFTNLKPLIRLTHDTWKQTAVLKCIENRIAVYSPHTTWDSIDGGINDWILSVFSK